MKPNLFLSLVFPIFITTLPSWGAEINISDISLSPDGTNATETLQTDIRPANGGNNVLPSTNGTVVYTVTTYTFGTASDAHFISRFNATGTQPRLGIRVQDSGLVDFVSTGDPGRTNFNLGSDLAGQTVTFLIKQEYNSSFDSLRATLGASDDTLMNVWVNPTPSSVEGSGLTAGDMHTLWNSANYGYFTHTIENQGTPGSAGDSLITDTVILTGSDATFANALAFATNSTPPTGIVDANSSIVSASPTTVPADGTATSSITVTLKEAGGNPVPGKEVSLSGNASALIETADNTSNSSGQVIFTVTSIESGTEEFTATNVTDGNLVITQTASVTFQEVVPVGPVDAGNSTISASSGTIAASGIATSTITVTLRDNNGALITGENVTLSGTPGNPDIAPSTTQTTDANGAATFTVSSTAIGTVTFSAISSTDNIAINQTAQVEFVDPATATAYNVNFLDDGQANETGLVGVVGQPGESWNQGTQSVSNLVDSTGLTTSSVSVTGLSNSGRPISGSSLSVFKGNRDIFGKGTDITFSITGLTPDTSYDLYIYALSHNTASWGDITNTERAAGDFVTTNTVLGNGQSQFLDNAFAGTNGNSFVPNGNYVVFQAIVTDNSGNISILVDAYDGIDGIPGTGDGDCRLHLCGLQIRPASGTSVDYTAWRNDYYPTLGLPGEDDDGDSLSNDYERIFGLDPTDPSSNNPYASPFDPATGSFSYSRRSPSSESLNYKLWYSTDLQQWFEDNAAYQTSQSVTNDVEIMSVSIDPSLLNETNLFIQMRAANLTEVDPEPSLANLWGSGNTITLLFSEPMNPSSAGNLNNYMVQQEGAGPIGITNASVGSDGGSVTLTLDATLANDTGYTVNIDGVTSSTGQSLPGQASQFTTWDDDPTGIKVFILAGQSNMVGFGNVEDGNTGAGTIGSLRYLALNNDLPQYDDYDYTSLLTDPGNPNSAFANRSDVKVWYRDGGNGNLGGAIKKGDLGPPYMGRDNGKIGPEYGFGQIVGNYYASDDVLIIKCAWGGRDLAEKFRPPSAVASRGGKVGDFFNATINQAREVLNNLDTEFPEWSGRGYEIVGFGWHQGYNDRINSAFSAEYKDNLPNLISDVRVVFNKPNMPFVIASTGMGGDAVEPAPFPGYSEVEKAQLWVAGVAKPNNVLSTDTRGFWRDGSESPVTSGQGFHWNHNAETQFLIGKSLGDQMVDLLSQ